MRRPLLALASAILLLCSGCAPTPSPQTNTLSYDLYFQEANLYSAMGKDVLRCEAIALEEQSPQELSTALLNALLDGPSDETLKSPFPSGTTLLSLKLEGSRARVDLSSHYGTLSGMALTLADYCITLTLTQLPEITTVSVTVR